MKQFWSFAIPFAFGAGFGVFGMQMDRMVELQKGYTQGRESVLSSVVSVGNGPCSLQIPLSVLADMVSVGVLDWHQECTKQVAKP